MANTDLDRLTSANYATYGADGFGHEGQFDEMVTYADRLGNIGSITRNGMDMSAPANVTLLDQLTMSYTDGQLTNIAELGDFTRGYKGTGGAYTYDVMGNMTHDANKGLTIAYNFLNLPHQFTTNQGTMTMGYDANGVKLNQTVTDETGSYTQWYIEGIEYRTANAVTQIQAIYHEVGRYVYNGSAHYYEYTLRDHIGNTRVVFADKNDDGNVAVPTEIIQDSDYYPFGLEMETPQTIQSTNGYAYKFNGIQRVKDLDIGLDLAAFRSYDPTIGRWNQVDAYAEMAYNWTPYRFGFANPVTFADPLGLFETKKEAQAYKKEHGIKGHVVKEKDGTFSIESKKAKTSTFKDMDGNVQTAALVTTKSKVGQTVDDAAKQNGVADQASLLLEGYKKGVNSYSNDQRRIWSHELSKVTDMSSGEIFQGHRRLLKSANKFMAKAGVVGTVLTATVIANEIKEDTWDAHTVVDGTLLIVGVGATIFGAPAVLTGIAVYGVVNYYFDIGAQLDDSILGRNSELWENKKP